MNDINLGQIYTKEVVADFMVELLNIPKDSSIVDPCFGTGVFVKSLHKYGFKNVVAIELDKQSYDASKENLENICELHNMDFFKFESTEEIDAFILNPPYVRQEEIDDMSPLGINKVFISQHCGDFRLYSKANLYLYFIARCITLVKNGGQIVAIFPNAWLNTPGGKNFYKQIENFGRIDLIIQVDGSPFIGDPLVDVIILKFTKGAQGETAKQRIFVDKENIIETNNVETINFENYGGVQLSSVAKIRRGITTGFNKMFINPTGFIPSTYLTNIISTPKNVYGFTTNRAKTDKLLTITNENDLPEEVAAYLDNCKSYIIEHQEPKVLLEQIEKGRTWYVINPTEPSDIIFPYIIRDEVRFILNETKLQARDNFYTISSDLNTLLLVALLNNYYVYYQLELFGKSYGNGLLKIQKYDVDNIIIPNPDLLNSETTEKLIHYSKLLIKTANVENIDRITELLSSTFKVDDMKTIYLSVKQDRLNYGL